MSVASTIDSVLGRVIGDDGIKTDIKVSLAEHNYYKIGLAVFIPVFVLLAIAFVFRNVNKK